VFPLPLVVTVKPSRILRWVLAALHLAAGAALGLADLPGSWRIAGLALLAASLLFHWRGGREITLRGKRDGALEILENGVWRPATLIAADPVLAGLGFLRYRLPGHRRSRSLIVLPDGLPEEDFRRLRVWLKWLGKKPGNGTASRGG
jgi:toxin CptA